MKICFANFYSCEPTWTALDRFPILRRLPGALAERGHEVRLVHLAPHDADLSDGEVEIRFRSSGLWSRALGRAVGAILRREPSFYEPAFAAVREIAAGRPDAVHVFGTGLHLNPALLLRHLGPAGPPVLLHHHGGEPSPGWARQLQRANLRRSARVLFTARAHAEPFVNSGLLEVEQVAELLETSSPLEPLPRAEARRRSGMTGDPICLSAARLHPLKDPHTVLRGFERIAEVRPEARLYLHYTTDELLPELRARVEDRPGLRGRVHFGGCVGSDRLAEIFSSADFLLQASRREWSGIAVLDAMACGAVPVVGDLPSMRAMTAGGRLGVLFPAGDAAALAEGVLAFSRDELAARSLAVREHFVRHLSFAALARQLEAIDLDLLARRSGAPGQLRKKKTTTPVTET